MVINHIGVSGGKDSTALLLWAIHESGYERDSLRVSFCDTGNEHELTYEQVGYLSDYCEANGVRPIQWLYPNLDFYALAKKKGRFPSAKARFCTEHLKLVPFKAYVQWYVDGGHEVLLHSGVRANESEGRSKLRERGTNSYTGLPERRPLISWTIDDVWAIHERYGVRRNPLYEMGMSRVGCMPCVMSRKGEMAKIAETFPDRIDVIRETEKANLPRSFNSFFARTAVPLRFRSRTVTVPAKGARTVKLSGLFVGETLDVLPEDAKEVNVPTIDDVVRWATTPMAKRKEEKGPMFDIDPVLEPTGHWCGSGHCE